MDIPPDSPGRIRPESNPTGTRAIFPHHCRCSWDSQTQAAHDCREITPNSYDLEVIPQEWMYSSGERSRLLSHPSMVGPTNHQGIVTIAQARIVATIGIDPLLFVCCARNQARISIMAEQLHVRLKRIVTPVTRSCKKFGAPLVRLVAHRSLVKFPGTAKGLPLIGFLFSKGIVVRETLWAELKIRSQSQKAAHEE
jgi:hypothetical protein